MLASWWVRSSVLSSSVQNRTRALNNVQLRAFVVSSQKTLTIKGPSNSRQCVRVCVCAYVRPGKVLQPGSRLRAAANKWTFGHSQNPRPLSAASGNNCLILPWKQNTRNLLGLRTQTKITRMTYHLYLVFIGLCLNDVSTPASFKVDCRRARGERQIYI